MKIRVAQRAWAFAQPAKTMDEVVSGIHVLWVELDGHRYDRVASVTVQAAADAFTVPAITFDLIGPIEFVYLDANGNELGSVPVDPADVDGVTLGPDSIHLRLDPAEGVAFVGPVTLRGDQITVTGKDRWTAAALTADERVTLAERLIATVLATEDDDTIVPAAVVAANALNRLREVMDGVE